MSSRIEEIALPASVSNGYTTEEPFNSLRGISRLNVFVGPNNSGKSRLLRALFAAGDKLLVSTDDSDEHAVRQRSREMMKRLVEVADNTTAGTLRDTAGELFRDLSLGFFRCGSHHSAQRSNTDRVSELKKQCNGAMGINPVHRDFLITAAGRIIEGLNNLQVQRVQQNQQPGEQKGRFVNPKFVYVPTLRGMRLPASHEDFQFAYFDRTVTDYFPGLGSEKRTHDPDLEAMRRTMNGDRIVTGLDLYDTLASHLLGSLEDRSLIRAYEAFLSETFFKRAPVTLIPRLPRDRFDTVHVKVGNEKERPVESLGDGLQQLIILTFPLFKHRDKPLFLFIEEPDLFLHPGFQRVLIDSIVAEPDRDLYVFVTTHSSQFLDITVQEEHCSVFRFEKDPAPDDDREHEPTFTVTNVTPGDNSILKHLGIRPSSIMFANCTIWVEGLTDRLYFGRYLEILMRDKPVTFIENLHYAFVEYGGGNITHWSFLDETGPSVERICSRLFLIADGDQKDDAQKGGSKKSEWKKDQRHKKLKEVLGDRFYLLKARESENLLTPEVIEAVIRDYEAPDVKLKKFGQSAYDTEYLGAFIDEHVLEDKSLSKRMKEGTKSPYADASGTVKGKVVFCNKALKHINCVDDMSAEAMKLAKMMLAFIEKENE